MRGRDIKRYSYDFADLWLINAHNGVKDKNIPPIDIDNYPAIKEYLNRYYAQLVQRQDKGDSPYNLRNCVYMDDFSKQKIIYPETTQGAYFIVDNGNFYADKTCFIMLSKCPYYLLAMLSSSLFEFAYKHIYSSIALGDNGYQYNKHALLLLPIIGTSDLDSAISDELSALALAALSSRSTNNKTEVINSIDKLIYDIYHITAEEIEYINNHRFLM